MRRLLHFTIGFACACMACAYVQDDLWKIAIAAALVLVLCFISRKRQFWKKLLVTVIGCCAGFACFLWFHTMYLQPVLRMDGKVLPVAIRAADFGENVNYATYFDGTVVLSGKSYRIQTQLDGSVEVEPGDQVAGRFYIRVIETGVKPGQGIFVAAYQEGTVTTAKAQSLWWDDIARFRSQIKGILMEVFPEDTESFARALFLGDTSGLTYEIDTAMKISGMRHVVAVSGLHISILCGLLSTITFRRRFPMALIGYPVLFFFAAVTGFSPSVVRASLMWGLVLLAKLIDREYDGPTALSFAVLVMLMMNPLMITAVSFQLSIASVAGIFLFAQNVTSWLRSFTGEGKGKGIWARLIRWSTASIGITIGASVLTTPLSAYYFGMVSLVSVATNLLALWVISGIFYGIIGVCLLYLAAPTAAVYLAAVISWPIRYVFLVATGMASLPFAAVYTSSPYIIAWLICSYLLLVVYLSGENRHTALFCSCVGLALCFALTVEWAEAMGDELRFTMLDVGQGQSILLQSEGRSFLVDCGGDSDREAADQAAEALLRQGVDTLDGLILTHLDQDHAGGVQGLLSRIDTELLILPKEHTTLPEMTDAQTVIATEVLEIAFGDTFIRVYPATFPGNSNEKSLCVLFDTKKCDILITGDRDGYGERSLLRNWNIPDVDILVAGHHGSKNSTCAELLAAVKPEIVWISVGKDNSYGHPSAELLQRLKTFGCEVHRTDLEGSLTIRR